jgi:uncharacterized protein YdhG (YjbR/CyaY superfamily)
MESKINYNNIDEYIALQPEYIRPTLELLRQTIKIAAPQAEEIISYQMPAYKFHGILIFFAAFKNHYSAFVRPRVMEVFKPKLKEFVLTKSAIRFPLNTPVQKELISEIVKYAANENLNEMQIKQNVKKAKKGSK